MKAKVILWALLLCLGVSAAPAQLASPFSNSVWPAQTFTSTAQTSAILQLNGLTVSSTVGSSFASGTVTVTGTSLTTVTFAIMASADNGATFYALPIYTQASPTTAPTTTITATANGVYQVNLAGVTHVKFVTSGTFTATSVSLVLSASPNVSVAKNGSGGGAGLPTGFTANAGTGILTVPSGYATSGAQETTLYETQGTAAAAAPANTIRRGAPLSVPSSYDAYDPSLAPADTAGDVEVCPSGGGTCAWKSPVWQLIQRQQLSSATSTVTFSSIPQTYQNLVFIASGTGGTGNTAKWLKFNVNGDGTSADYFQTFLSMTYAGAFTYGGNFSNPGCYSGVDGSTATFYNYQASVGVHIDSIGTAGGSIVGLAYTGCIWAGSAPITSFTVATDDGSTLATGGVFALYGVN